MQLKKEHLAFCRVALFFALAFVAFNAGGLSALQAQERQRRADSPPPSQTPANDDSNKQPSLQDPTQNPQGQQVDPEEIVKVESREVTLQVRVVDRANHPINNLTAQDFHVFDNGVPQTITSFTTKEVPITYGLVVDTSGSMRTQLEKVIEAGKKIIESNRPGDETCLVKFVDSQNIEVKQDFTPDKTSLFDALDSLYVEPGQTAVLDAVYLSADHVTNYRKGDPLNDKRRRALIIVTDGEDRNSFYKQEQLFARLREDAVQIYVIGFVGELEKEGGMIRKSPRDKAVALINRLAQETGGRAFFPNSLSELPQIAQEITRDLRTQYVIGYVPSDKGTPGQYRTLKVTVADNGRDKRIAITRPGYTVGGDKSNKPTNAPVSNTRTSLNQTPDRRP
jgi:Ca-activated chloride channel family protein